MDCIKCGGELREHDAYCGKCGNKVKPEREKHLNLIRVYGNVMTILYGIALLTCFICNLAVEGTLSWFFVVLAGVALAYSVTNVPAMVRRHRLVISGLCATVMLYVLLFVCNWFAKGDWLFGVAYPLATVSLVFAWGILLICASRRMNWLLKSAFISLLAGGAAVTINISCDYLLGGTVHLYDYFSPFYWPPAIIGNKIAFICCVCYFLIVSTRNTCYKYVEKA